VTALVDTVVDRALSFFFGPSAIRSPWDPQSRVDKSRRESGSSGNAEQEGRKELE